MQFNDLLSDIGKLVGKQLQSINPSTAPIFLTKIDKKARKYFISNDPDKVGNARFFWELEDIWNDLQFKGFSNVDQALYGSGSSRNQPETVFANLPYIEHFKYKKKKHILLRTEKTHDLGTLKEVEGAEFRALRKKIDNYFELTNKDIVNEQRELLDLLTSSLDAVMKKYPGEVSIQDTEKALDRLSDLTDRVIAGTISKTEDKVQLVISDRVSEKTDFSNNALPIEQMLDKPMVTGVDDDGESDDESDDSEQVATSFDSRSKNVKPIRQLTPVLSLIYDRIQFEDIELQPDFQRKDRIWKEDKKAKLIESILMGLPLPVFYFAVKPNGTWIIVDGLQRITSVYDFMRGEFPLKDLKVLGDKYDGLYFRDLERTQQRSIREYAITAYLIDMDKDTDNSNVLVELFHRINTYGVKLSPQEIRSAMNQGSSVKFLRYISATSEFKKATHHKVKPDRQKDMELCLSALSFMVNGYHKFGTKNYEGYDEFLSQAMKRLNSYKLIVNEAEDLDGGNSSLASGTSTYYYELERRFKQGLELAYDIFGTSAFRKSLNSRNAPISKQLFELLVSCFSVLNSEQIEQLKDSSESLVDCLYSAIESDSSEYATWESDVYDETNRGFMYSISTSTGKKVTVNYRFQSLEKILKESTGVDIKFGPLFGDAK
ncbi:DUF262 domain-containing protein [Vibrio vulnificus]|uniref:DUF262 domain-containing protein n=1 Tax=Vibrio vulnificus TaxID=672 RepID=UPI000735533A|nr:DUF262 domain-containing protein [Vibrio vulnificus]ELK8507675.1 DUF262 domain-containing protein [Vibrio vulnificus]ELK8994247.1 DUF262 domain-containing protein [Vibrio vulnificus]ELS3447537.1 DUF262 domain-containing protein [Vibrio vulnificus]ELS9097028.1 DUF262 domain-containing protein [Vibrio vulnificus]MDK2636290.1 DUF262 domain-containing protein [Vibrio vulnificus]